MDELIFVTSARCPVSLVCARLCTRHEVSFPQSDF